MTACQDEWESLAQALGVVVVHILEEFEEMCRRSAFDTEARAALSQLSALMGAERD